MKLIFLTISVLSMLNVQFAKSEQEIGQVTMDILSATASHELQHESSHAGSSGAAIIKLSEKFRTHSLKSEVDAAEDADAAEVADAAEDGGIRGWWTRTSCDEKTGKCTTVRCPGRTRC